MKKLAFNKENPVDLFSQLVKVLSREGEENFGDLIEDIRNLSIKVFNELKKLKHASLNERLVMNSVSKNSIYYYNKPNIFRPNVKELDSRIFFCPKCKSKLSIPRNRIIKIFYICPSCGFEISKEKVLETKEQVEEYMVENKKRKKDQIVEACINIASEIIEESVVDKLVKDLGITFYERQFRNEIQIALNSKSLNKVTKILQTYGFYLDHKKAKKLALKLLNKSYK